MEPFRFSGHETFPCRYAWLPKAAREVNREPSVFSSDREDDAMVRLGVGKNMVRAIRFWAEVMDIIATTATPRVPRCDAAPAFGGIRPT